jgi:RNA recognition motif-containing protein
VANLPQSCSWQVLKQKFREAGEVLYAEMRDKNTGIVRFASERDAERAVKVFDQSRVDGRTVDVHFL